MLSINQRYSAIRKCNRNIRQEWRIISGHIAALLVQLQSTGLSRTSAEFEIAEKTGIAIDRVRNLPAAFKYFNTKRISEAHCLNLSLTSMCLLVTPQVKNATRAYFIKRAKAGFRPCISAVRWQIWHDNNKASGKKATTLSPVAEFVIRTEHLKLDVFTSKKMTAKQMRKELLAGLADGEAEITRKITRRYRRAA